MLNYTDLASEIVRDVVAKTPGFAHINPEFVAVAAAPRWAGSTRGSLAFCTGLQSDSDALFSVWVKSGTRTVVEVSPWFRRQSLEVHFDSVKCRYLISLHLPRLLIHDPLETIIHELYHINEKFDGTLRAIRHGKIFDWRVKGLMRDYLAKADSDLADVSRMRIKALRGRFGPIVARSLPWNFRSSVLVPTAAPCSYEAGMAEHYPQYQLSTNYRVRPIKYASARTRRCLTETDCALRAYHAQGARNIAAPHTRYVNVEPISNGQVISLNRAVAKTWR